MASVPEIAFAKTPKPTLAQIAAAKAAEIAKQSAAAAAQAKLNSATKTLRQLSALADAAAARYRKAQADLIVAIAQAQTAAAHYAIAQASVSQANKTIGRMAQNAYIMGSGFTDLESVLHATGPQDLMDRLSTLNSLGANNSAALARFKAASIVAQAAKVEADRTKAAQVVATNQVAATKKAADDSKAIQQKEVNRLMAVQNQLAKELANARNVRITLEQQRQLALLEEASAAKAAVTPNQYRVWGGTFKGRTTIRSTDSIRAAAVAYATKQVKARKPYVWGAQGPNSFDCSGLVYAAYKAAGLGYPNWSRLNAALYFVDTQRVPLSQLVPGDLLFYSYDGSVQNIHHITIYAGNGKMWEANSTKAGLLFSDMYSIKGLMPSGGRV
jgi:cell wall-associated NlpC family hydrolase